VLDFLRSTYVGRAVPPVGENWDSVDEEEEVVEADEVEAVEGRASSDPRAPDVGLRRPVATRRIKTGSVAACMQGCRFLPYSATTPATATQIKK